MATMQALEEHTREDGTVWYKLYDVLTKVLQQKRPDCWQSHNIAFLESNECYYSKIDKRQPNTWFVQKDGGYKHLLARSVPNARLPSSTKASILQQVGLPHMIFTHTECDTVTTLAKAFPDQDPIAEYHVVGYRIDLYLRQSNIAIECDNHNHKDYDQVQEAIRTNRINSALHCSWVRFNPLSEDYNIGDVMYRIRRALA
jgi:hypothetical protein